MVNHDSKEIPVEDIPVGTMGTVTWIGDNEYKQIGVNWDNGRGLCLLPHDEYEIVE